MWVRFPSPEPLKGENMKNVTLVTYHNGSTVFVTTLANEENFKSGLFGSPESELKIEDFERKESVNLVAFHVHEE
jgi:hypothetical protein